MFFDLFVSDVDPAEFFFRSFPDIFSEVPYFIGMIFHCYFAVSFFDLFITGTAVDAQNLIGGFDVIVIHGFYGHESDMIDAQPVGNIFEQTDLGRTDGAVCFGNTEQEIEQLYFRSF